MSEKGQMLWVKMVGVSNRERERERERHTLTHTILTPTIVEIGSAGRDIVNH